MSTTSGDKAKGAAHGTESGGGRPRAWATWALLAAAAAIAALPLLIGAGAHLEEPFSGADAQAEETVEEIAPSYEPWFSPLYEAPSAEVESGLFALQAAVGAGVIGYTLGVLRTRRRLRAEAATAAAASPSPDENGPTAGTAS
ncbi:energy-coupling factor ABC transporter substrate-binding protein [Nocardiopsis sp. RSe5-2]|uniref:Cobalt transport protein CbiN n=1 Tax=Nocardiopsis endophytica TaxID=3018445 RepID=A0ABT4UAS9_9ACTN|nr:energy-coupling factor ABC transporter substrate-binding protein [Nocardiopsis endophytica]MDA2814075.1 energy-coupling factor ABC transporter substrate-binding protein [Nocardiopsis endophytica]